MFPLLQLLVVWKRNAINPLQWFCICFSFPVSSRILQCNMKYKLCNWCGYLGDSKSFHFASVPHMRALAKINKGATPTKLHKMPQHKLVIILPVHCGSGCLHSLIENTQLKLIVLDTYKTYHIKSYNDRLTLNISKRSSFFISKRIKGCFSFVIDLQSVSTCGKSLLDTCLCIEYDTVVINYRITNLSLRNMS